MDSTPPASAASSESKSPVTAAPPHSTAVNGAPGNPWPRRIAIGLLLLFHLVLANAASWNKSITFDEVSHIGNGYSFWATGDYRMSPDSILAQRWMTLPIYLGGAKGPPTDDEVWFKADVWNYGRRLLFETGNDHWSLVHTTRFTNSLWNVGTGLIVFWWASKLFGTSGGFVALISFLFNPTVLGHGSLITIDTAATFAFTASIAALWQVLHVVSPLTVALSCLAVGCAFVTKFSAVLLVPIGLLIALVRILGQRPLTVRGFGPERQITVAWKQLLIIGGLVVLHVVAAWIIIWAVFGFRYEMMLNAVPGRDVPFHVGNWEDAVKRAKTPIIPNEPERNLAILSLIEAVHARKLLPEAYLTVFVGSLGTTAVRSSFLNGRYGIFGFWEFFPCCFLYKTPLAVFLLMLAALAAHVTRRIRQINVEQRSPTLLLWTGFYATAPLWSLLVIYWLLSITRGINIGIRHILPTFPATFILLGAAGAWGYGLLRRGNDGPANDPDDEARFRALPPGILRLGRFAVLGLTAWLVAAVLWAYPNYLAYFNSASGGIDQGYTHLVDSSLDWGQELPALQQWLDENVYRSANAPPVFISYMGSAPPSKYGVRGRWLPCYFDISAIEGGNVTGIGRNFEPGVYCISATMLQCVYNQTPFGISFAGPWRQDYEALYQRLNELAAFYAANQNNQAALDAKLASAGVPNWAVVAKLFEHASFGRLCALLRHRTPEAVINGSFLIYRVTKDDLLKALTNPTPAEAYPPPASPMANVPY